MKPVESSKTAELCLVIPNAGRTGNALVVALIEYDTAFGDHLIFAFVDGDLVGLQAVDAEAHIDMSLMCDDAFSVFAFDGLVIGIHDDLAVAAFLFEAWFFLCFRRGDVLLGRNRD